MPSFKNLSDKDLDILSNWVLFQSSNIGHMGKMGMMHGQGCNNANMTANRYQMQNQSNQNRSK